MVEQENTLFFRELSRFFSQKLDSKKGFIDFIVIFVTAPNNRIRDGIFHRMAQYLLSTD